MRARRPAALLLGAVLLGGPLLSGCGSDGSGGTGGSGGPGAADPAAGSATTVLGPALDRVDAAVVSDSPTRIVAAVAALRRATDAAVADGTLTSARAQEIDAAAQALLDAVPPAPTPTPTPTPTPAPPPRPEPEEHGHGPGHGEARGHEKHD